MKRSYIELKNTIAAAAAQYSLDPALICATIEHESEWDDEVIGDSGNAIGLMQMHPSAAADVRVNWEDLKGNPTLQVMAGAHYLSLMLSQFPSDTQSGIAAYNQGAGRIKAIAAYVKLTNLLWRKWQNFIEQEEKGSAS